MNSCTLQAHIHPADIGTASIGGCPSPSLRGPCLPFLRPGRGMSAVCGACRPAPGAGAPAGRPACQVAARGVSAAARLARLAARAPQRPAPPPPPQRRPAVAARARGRSGSSAGHRSGSSAGHRGGGGGGPSRGGSPAWQRSGSGWRARDDAPGSPAPPEAADEPAPSDGGGAYSAPINSFVYTPRPASSSSGGGGYAYGRAPSPAPAAPSPPPSPPAAAAAAPTVAAVGAASFLQGFPVLGARTPLGATLASRLRAGAGGGGGTGGGPGAGAPDAGDAYAASWAPAGDGSGSDADAAAPALAGDAGRVSRVALAALLPVAAWALTWGLTSGLAGLADACMGGMCGVARALFPTLPLRGVTHEDVAVSLVKGLQAGTADDASWTRPGARGAGGGGRGASGLRVPWSFSRE
jgi:hypothetical protein